MKKIFVLSALLLVPLISCGKKDTGGKNHNPFDSKYEITKQRASDLVETWMTSLSRTAVYTAHLSYSSVLKSSQNVDKYYVVDYSGHFEETTSISGRYDAYYDLTLVPNSLVAEESNISESEVPQSSYCGKGLTVAKGCYTSGDDVVKYKYYYYSDDKFGIYGSYSENGISGYLIRIMDKNGLVSYSEDFEAEGKNSWKAIATATFTKTNA